MKFTKKTFTNLQSFFPFSKDSLFLYKNNLTLLKILRILKFVSQKKGSISFFLSPLLAPYVCLNSYNNKNASFMYSDKSYFLYNNNLNKPDLVVILGDAPFSLINSFKKSNVLIICCNNSFQGDFNLPVFSNDWKTLWVLFQLFNSQITY